MICIECLPGLAETRESGFGPLRRGVMEVRCPACDGLVHRTEFPSELEQTARAAFGRGRAKVKELIVRAGLESIQRQIRRG